MDDWKELIKDFFDEAYSLLTSLEESLLNLEKNLNDPAAIEVVFRVAHTIKGGSGAVGFDDITRLTHIMEDILDLVRHHQYQFNQEDITLLLQVKDELEVLLQAHENNQTPDSTKVKTLITALENIKAQALTLKQTHDQPKTQAFNIDNLPIAARFGFNYELFYSLKDALNAEEKLLFIEIRFNEEYEMKDVGPFEIMSIINNFAEPIIMNPPPETIEEEYLPYLNIVIPCNEKPEYVKNKLMIPDVVSRISVKLLDKEFFSKIEQSMYGNDVNNSIQIQENITKETKETKETKVKEKDIPQTNNDEETIINIVEPPTHTEKRNPTLKVESSRIDELLNLLGELVIVRSGFAQFETELEKGIQDTRYSLRNFLSSSLQLQLHDDKEQNKQRNEILRDSFKQISNGFDKYVEYQQQLSRISSILQTRMMTLRMVPIQTVFSRFSRLTRDIAKQLHKKIELVIEGGDTEIDKGMIDDLYDPLLHMIRNSLDHGIELPEERLRSGKPEVGIIRLRAYQEGDAIFIEITDDGKGIDPNKIKEKALSLGLITPEEAQIMNKTEIFSLIFKPGFSTAEIISNLSGRGVGMDVVYRKIEELGGNIAVYSELGEGSTIRLQLPLTLAIIQGLLVIVGGINYVVPIASVEETVMLDISTLKKLNHYYALVFRDQLIPLIPLSLFLYGIDTFEPLYNQNSQNSEKQGYRDYCVIIIRYANRQVGIVVPEILGEQDIVIKALDNQLVSSPGIAAATIVGNGEIGFILDISQIIRHHLKKT